MMWPLFHRHPMRPVAVQRIEDVSFGTPGILTTVVLFACDRCAHRATRRFAGYWTLEQVTGEETP